MANGVFPLTRSSYYHRSRSIYMEASGNSEEKMGGVFMRTEKNIQVSCTKVANYCNLSWK